MTMPATIQHLSACRIEGANLFLPDYQIPRDEYLQVKRAIEGIDGIWNRTRQAFVFDESPAHLLDRLKQGEVIDLLADFKKRTQFFATPWDVIDQMHEYFFIAANARVLEPSAGNGAICDYLFEHYPQENYAWNLSVCEKEPRLQSILRQKGYTLIHDDFMTMYRPENGYNNIIANPPFRGDQDITHIMKMYGFLAPGGRLVSIMRDLDYAPVSPKVEAFRNFLDDVGYYSEEKLPRGAFRASGTGIATQLLVLDMPLY